MVTLGPEMWEGSVDKVVSPCGPLAGTVFAQGIAFIGWWNLVPPKLSLPFEKTAPIALSNMIMHVPIIRLERK